jgi:hypothetical protein
MAFPKPVSFGHLKISFAGRSSPSQPESETRSVERGSSTEELILMDYWPFAALCIPSCFANASMALYVSTLRKIACTYSRV